MDQSHLPPLQRAQQPYGDPYGAERGEYNRRQYSLHSQLSLPTKEDLSFLASLYGDSDLRRTSSEKIPQTSLPPLPSPHAKPETEIIHGDGALLYQQLGSHPRYVRTETNHRAAPPRANSNPNIPPPVRTHVAAFEDQAPPERRAKQEASRRSYREEQYRPVRQPEVRRSSTGSTEVRATWSPLPVGTRLSQGEGAYVQTKRADTGGGASTASLAHPPSALKNKIRANAGMDSLDSNWQPKNRGLPEFMHPSADGPLCKIPLFAVMSVQDRKAVFEAMHKHEYKAGDIIMQQGEEGTNFCVIEEGECHVLKTAQPAEEGKEEEDSATVPCGGSQPHLINWLGPGDGFGELSLLNNTRRIASVVARTDAVIWVLPAKDFQERLRGLIDGRRKLYSALLERVPLIENLNTYLRARLADVCMPMEFEKGQVVIQQGATMNLFFVVEMGDATVSMSSPKYRELRRLTRGDYFGEVSLLHDTPCTVTITANTFFRILSLERIAFWQQITTDGAQVKNVLRVYKGKAGYDEYRYDFANHKVMKVHSQSSVRHPLRRPSLEGRDTDTGLTKIRSNLSSGSITLDDDADTGSPSAGTLGARRGSFAEFDVETQEPEEEEVVMRIDQTNLKVRRRSLNNVQRRQSEAELMRLHSHGHDEDSAPVADLPTPTVKDTPEEPDYDEVMNKGSPMQGPAEAMSRFRRKRSSSMPEVHAMINGEFSIRPEHQQDHGPAQAGPKYQKCLLTDEEFTMLFLVWAVHTVTLSGALREDQFRELAMQIWNQYRHADVTWQRVLCMVEQWPYFSSSSNLTNNFLEYLCYRNNGHKVMMDNEAMCTPNADLLQEARAFLQLNHHRKSGVFPPRHMVEAYQEDAKHLMVRLATDGGPPEIRVVEKHLKMTNFTSIRSHLEETKVLPEWLMIDWAEVVIYPEKEKVLGQGWTSTVRRGRYRGCEVVVKLLGEDVDGRPMDRPREEYEDMLVREVELLSKLMPCPHVVKMLGYCITPHIAIIFDDGGMSLHKLLHGPHKPIISDKHLRLCLARDAAAALWHLQENNIVHCDIAPRNFLVQRINGEYRLFVCDFGLGRIRRSTGRVTGDPQIDSIRQAPEVLMDGAVSPKSDVYSFGLLLWELVSGTDVEQAFYGLPNPTAIITNERNPQRHPKIPEYTYPDELKDLMQVCWMFNRDHRPTMKQVFHYMEEMVQESEYEQEYNAASARLSREHK